MQIRQRLVATITPIYKARLDDEERSRVRLSLRNTPAGTMYFVGPKSLDTSWYSDEFPTVPFIGFANKHFRSIESYSRWMLKPSLYRRFLGHDFVLICQTDAVLCRPLPVDESWEFDYLGAPWVPPKLIGWDSKKRRLKGRGSARKRALYVGNGGLSLRRTSTFARRLKFPRFKEFPLEDKAISYFATDLAIRLADTETASRYFMETGATTWSPGDPIPDVLGFHGLARQNPELEQRVLAALSPADDVFRSPFPFNDQE